ncbi:MAG: 1-acyl-sn-glycerol-3-phosphate acyltransferase [Prevotellaceae bacterium]|jgi:putative hemolysin|nr:1-acyl-sn-glycerol-3-phosphate acyltransferase [Prevotellaceae bacterium]
MDDSLFTVDLDKTFRDKNPKLYKMLPKFVMNYLKKIVHQDEVNEILTTYGYEHRGLAFNRKVLEHLNITYSTVNWENFPPQDGRYIFASNHPLGGLDGIVLIDLIGEHYGNVKFIVNDLLMYLTPLRDVFAPVNKHGRQHANYVMMIDELYSSDKQVLYFPAGLCSRKIKSEIIDLEWKKSFVVKAIKYKRDIVPMFFDGRNSNFFYNLANIRKALGIKANIEMLYLSDEMFRQKNAQFTVKIGKNIPYGDLQKMGTRKAIEYVRNKVYELRKI